MKVTRENGQEAVITAYQRYLFLLVEYCTGFGKGKAALDAILRRYTKNELPRGNGIIIVPNEPARDITWPEEIAKFASDIKKYTDYRIVCYAGLKNMDGLHFDWCISDECHYITLNNSSFYSKNKIASHILMTGVLPDEDSKIKILKKLSNKVKLTITLDEAVDSGVLNDYRVNIWRVPMTALEKVKYLSICKKVDSSTNRGNFFAIQASIRRRTDFLYNIESKYQAACYLRDQLRNAQRRFVIFTGSKIMADRLSPYRIYDGSDANDYSRFLNMEIDEIASIKMIQESANIKRLQAALMHQVNSKQLNFMQKLGRLMRLEPGEIAKVHATCVKDTYDESWMYNATKLLDPKKVVWRDLDPDLFSHYT